MHAKCWSALDRWNEERSEQGQPQIGIGIGVHFGPAVLGDIGSERSMAFTVIGDTVNSASRLEGLTRSLDTDLVVSQALVRRVREEADESESKILQDLHDAGEQEVKGRHGKIPILALHRDHPA